MFLVGLPTRPREEAKDKSENFGTNWEDPKNTGETRGSPTKDKHGRIETEAKDTFFQKTCFSKESEPRITKHVSSLGAQIARFKLQQLEIAVNRHGLRLQNISEIATGSPLNLLRSEKDIATEIAVMGIAAISNLAGWI